MVQLGYPMGTLIPSSAFALVLMLPKEYVDAWGWRLPFLLAFPLMAIALHIWVKVQESPVFREPQKLDDRPKVPAVRVFTWAGDRRFATIMATLMGVGGFYVMNTFMRNYVTSTLGVDCKTMSTRPWWPPT